MKQSERVKEASRKAIAKLSGMSKEELDRRLAARELGPVGRLLLETGTIQAMMDEGPRWLSAHIVLNVSRSPEYAAAADTNVEYTLATGSVSSNRTPSFRSSDISTIRAEESDIWSIAA